MRMRKLSLVLGALSAALSLALLSSVAKADQFNKETVVTFTQPVAIPGHVLPAGTYDFSLASSTAEQRIVEIRSKDDMHVLALVMTRPVWGTQWAGHTEITFERRGSDQPEAIKDWFYPGEKFGVEFVYSGSSDHAPMPAVDE